MNELTKMTRKKFNKADILELLNLVGACTLEYLTYLLTTLPIVFVRQSLPKGLQEIEKQQKKMRANVAVYQQIYRLKKQCHVKILPNKKVEITPNGVKYAAKHPSWSKIYEPVINNHKNRSILIMFDIPEHLRMRRDWLRYKLKELRFKYLQLSVWFSDNFLLPADFIRDLKRYDIFQYVHILFIDRSIRLVDVD